MTTAAIEALAGTGITPQQILDLEGLSGADEGCVFLAGSLMEGMGNRFSDIDVFVVGSSEPTGPHAQRLGDQLYSAHAIGERRLDYAFWTDDAMRAVAAKVDALSLANAGERGAVMFRYRVDDPELLLIHRVRAGVPILHADRFERLRAAFDFGKVARYLAEASMHEIDAGLEDLYAMLEVHDADFAIPCARELLNTACDAYLHHLGNTNIRRKWRSRILERARGQGQADEIREAFWALQLADGHALRSSREKYQAYLKSCIQLTHRITNAIIG